MAGIPELSNRECLTGSAYLHLRIRKRIQKIGILQINLVRSGKFTYAFRVGIQQIEINGQAVNLLTLHLWPHSYGLGGSSSANNEGDRYREFEIRYICEKTLKNPAYSGLQNWLMLGDFNSHSPLDNWIYNYSETDTKLLAHRWILENTDMIDIIAERYKGTFMSTTSGNSRIDYIYASPDIYDRIVNAWVIVDSWTVPVISPYVDNFYNPSDHRPILVDFDME